jgi:hypothetical protein
MDRKRVVGEVAARHGVRLEEDDPAFLLVTIAEIALRDAQAEFTAAVRRAIADHEAAAERMQIRLGETLGQSTRGRLRATESPPKDSAPPFSVTAIAFGLLSGVLLFAAGFVLGARYL